MGIVFRSPRPVVGDDDIDGHEQTVAALLRFLNRTAWGRGEGSNQHLVLVRPIRESYRITEVVVQPLSKVAVKKYAAGDVFHAWVGFLSALVGCLSAFLDCLSSFLGCLSSLVSFLSCAGQLSFMRFSVSFHALFGCLSSFLGCFSAR